MVKVPSSPVTAKKGWLTTPMYAFIQGWMLHFTGIRTSWRGKLCILSGAPGGWDSFQSWLVVGIGWILWLVGSEFLMSRFWPAMAPMTCGEYMQPVWVRATGVVGTAHVL